MTDKNKVHSEIVQTSLRVEEYVLLDIKTIAQSNKRSINSEICIALEQYIDRHHGK